MVILITSESNETFHIVPLSLLIVDILSAKSILGNEVLEDALTFLVFVEAEGNANISSKRVSV